jgi:glycosyltransferase involved in cell wall biosynthesis
MSSLAGAGIEGHIISRNRDGLPRFEKIATNFCVHRLRGYSNRFVNELVNIPAFFSPFWFSFVHRICKHYAIDLLLVRDLPLALTAIWVGRVIGKPVLMDMAENYPAMIEDTWLFRGPALQDIIIRNPRVLKRLEDYCLRRLNGIFAVSEHSRLRLLSKGVDPHKVRVIGNTPPIAVINSLVDFGFYRKIRDLSDFILLYVGGMEESRGLDTVIRALPYAKKNIPNLLFVIVGKGSSRGKLEDLTRHLKVVQNVLFTGWLDPKIIPSIIKASDVCIVPHYVTEHTQTTLPNKIFDYMAQKKPVVVTNSKSLTNIVVNSKCGMVYHHKNYRGLADLLINLDQPEFRRQLGEAGYRSIIDKYNWEFESMKLISAINLFKSLEKPLIF